MSEVPGLRQRRRLLGWNVGQLADVSGVNAKNIWNYEQGKAEPKASTLRALAAALATTTDELVGHAPVTA